MRKNEKNRPTRAREISFHFKPPAPAPDARVEVEDKEVRHKLE